MSVLVIDYGMGNLASVRRALEECGAQVVVSDDPAAIDTAVRIVIPGVGSFSDAMARLSQAGWVEPLRQAALRDRIPTLGICLGMQLLATSGTEGGLTVGLGLIDGAVERLSATDQDERIPHVGWNRVDWSYQHPLTEGVAPHSDFYFVHSYAFRPSAAVSQLASSPYCGSFASAVLRGSTVGFQFHPEKSSRAGFQLLRNFLSWQPNAQEANHSSPAHS